MAESSQPSVADSETGNEPHQRTVHKSNPLLQLRRLFQYPCLAQEWGDEQHHRQATWGELFYDLFFVVASINLSHIIEKEPSARGAGILFLYFSAFFFIWLDRLTFQTRVITKGFAVDIVDLVHFLGVLGMVLHCGDTKYYAQFAASYAVAAGAYCALLVFTAVLLPRARTTVLINIAFTTSTIVLSILAIFFSWNTFIGLLSAAHLVHALSVPISVWITPASAKIPVHVDHMNERLGLIMMIFLGETIVGLGLQSLSDTAGQYVGIMLAAVCVWNLHMIYFHTSPDQNNHALRLNRYRGLIWSHCHWLLGALFLMFGAGVRMTLDSWERDYGATHKRRQLRLLLAPSEDPGAGTYPAEAEHKVHRDDVYEAGAWILCLSYALSLHCMAVIRATHYFNLDHYVRRSSSQHTPVFRTLKKQDLVHTTDLWWAAVFISPFIVYFIPFAAQELGALGLLGYLAAHGMLYNLVETVITNHIAHALSQKSLLLPTTSAPALLTGSKDGASRETTDSPMQRSASLPAPRTGGNPARVVPWSPPPEPALAGTAGQ